MGCVPSLGGGGYSKVVGKYGLVIEDLALPSGVVKRLLKKFQYMDQTKHGRITMAQLNFYVGACVRLGRRAPSSRAGRRGRGPPRGD